MPVNASTAYAADGDFMARIATKVAAVEHDLGSVNQVIGEEIQVHFTGRLPGRRRANRVDGSAAINRSLAGSLELNARLTELEQGYDHSRAALHLEPGNLRRVVDTALRLSHQPTLVPTEDPDIPVDGPEAEVFRVPALSHGWQGTLAGLDTRLRPGVWRPVTFDPHAAAGRTDIALVHLGHPMAAKAQRLLRRSLWSADSPLHRITAVVVEDLPESVVAAVTRMVLVGRGGLRLHEEVFLAGVRLRGRRAMAEEKAERALSVPSTPGGCGWPRPSCGRSSPSCGASRAARCVPGCWSHGRTRGPAPRGRRRDAGMRAACSGG